MTELEQRIRESKSAWRKHVAALPVAEKLRMLEDMIADTRAIVASHPPKPANPVRHVKAPQGFKPKAEVIAGILDSIKERCD